MSRLFSDLADGQARRYFFSLTSAPGFVSPGVGRVVLGGNVANVVTPLLAFRTPATAVVTLSGLGFTAPSTLSPATAVLSAQGQIPARQLIRTITNALPPAVESPPASYAPTLITIWTTQPGVAQVMLGSLPLNVTPGGNIGFVSPGVGLVQLQSLQHTQIYGSVGLGSGVNVQGLTPTLITQLVVSPEVGQLTTEPLVPGLSLPFTWVDDDAAPTVTWITDAAA